MSQKVTTIPSVIIERVIRGNAAMNMLLVVGASAFIAIAAQIAIPLPFTPVPMTLQPLAVILVGAALGSMRGAAAALLYLLEGMSGLPVFAQGHGGPLWLIGATAGYLYSYPFAAFVAGWFSERGWSGNVFRALPGMFLALAIILTGGWAWLALLTSPRNAFLLGVAPFVVADLVKLVIGALILPSAQKLIAKV
ncbi:MAG TPA: biotin transporter BioY [Thermoanaerobaculia bacterium]|nr:biotin transporter BioY [Thermoanaerobaculia bacterium]